MADFAQWAIACEPALWPDGTFWDAYCGNGGDAAEGVIDGDPVADAVRTIMATRTEWTGTASELLSALAEAAGDHAPKSKAWPDNARALSGRLRLAAAFLRKIGIEIGFGRAGDRTRTRTIHITTNPVGSRPEYAGQEASEPSASPAAMSKSATVDGLTGPDLWAVADGTDSCGRGDCPTGRANPFELGAEADADGTDAKSPPQSGPEKLA